MRARIQPLLYVGNEPNLAKATAALLKGAGYSVKSAHPGNAASVFREGQYSGIILCATLSLHEASAVVDVLRNEQPTLPIISMHLGHLGDEPHPDSSVTVDALDGPAALIAAVNSVVLGTPELRRA